MNIPYGYCQFLIFHWNLLHLLPHFSWLHILPIIPWHVLQVHQQVLTVHYSQICWDWYCDLGWHVKQHFKCIPIISSEQLWEVHWGLLLPSQPMLSFVSRIEHFHRFPLYYACGVLLLEHLWVYKIALLCHWLWV